MAVLNFNTATPTGNRNQPFNNLTNPNERRNAKLWLNIGYETNGRFVNLPVGTPIDTMTAAPVRGQNEDWIKFQNARNELLKALQTIGAKLEPGQEMEVPNLVIKLRRVNEELEVSKEENEYSVDLVSLLTGVGQPSNEDHRIAAE